MKIEVKNLSHSYDGAPVLENVNLTFSSEKPTCIMGTSGRGKTTLFNAVLGLVKAEKGEIIAPEDIKYSAVFQEDRLAVHLSAVMNVAIVCENPDRQLISKALLSVGLTEDEISRPVEGLSGGQKRRVAIVRALLAESDALLMDEPLKGLDEATKINVIEFIKRNLNNRLLVVITHDSEEAGMLGAEIVEL